MDFRFPDFVLLGLTIHGFEPSRKVLEVPHLAGMLFTQRPLEDVAPAVMVPKLEAISAAAGDFADASAGFGAKLYIHQVKRAPDALFGALQFLGYGRYAFVLIDIHLPDESAGFPGH